ncbi:unnamed protein product, partial [Mesorhabditis belari]|uniref:Uncharacterized protein n=1 Tax=Mesorhabditis belari TaxID=2138241 RepID=A0AAF3JBG2_9BILA
MNRISQLKRIRDILAEDVEKKLMEGIALHDYDLRQIALITKRFQDVGLPSNVQCATRGTRGKRAGQKRLFAAGNCRREEG